MFLHFRTLTTKFFLIPFATNTPLLLSGLYFSLTLLWTQLFSILSAVLYQRYYVVVDVELTRSKIGAVQMYSVVFGLVATWVLAFGLFLKRINPKYIRTFFDTKTGSQCTIDLFQTGDDAMKSEIFLYNKRQWSSIRGEVMTWTRTNWKMWIDTKPVWFTPHFIATVPDEFIPIEVDPLRRRSSAFEDFVGFGSDKGAEKVGGGGRTNWGQQKSSRKVADAPAELGVVNGNVNEEA